MLKRAIVEIASFSGVHHLFAPFYGGHTSILLLHRVKPGPRRGMPTDALEVTPEFLDEFIHTKKRDGWRFISLDYLVDQFDDCVRRKRNMVLTLDDGYRDNFTHAWPLFRAHEVPFTVYVTNAFPNGTADLWWYTFVDLLATHRRIEIDHRSTRLTLSDDTPGAAFEVFKRFYTGIDRGEQQEVMAKLRARYPLASMDERECMNWDEIRELAGDDLCTIGAHTLTHRSLGSMTSEEAVSEMHLSMMEIEEKTGRNVRHLAYPFGKARDASRREAALAREAGFASAVTTRIGNIFTEHRDHLQMLPRIPLYEGGKNERLSEIFLSGMYSAVTNRFRRMVTD